MSRLEERIENFNKAFELFTTMRNNFVTDKQNDSNKLALTQSFEIIFELGWKVLKDYLAVKSIEVYTPKDVIKSAFAANIIKNGQVWIDMANDKNASSHEYNMDKVSKILENISTLYYDELCRFKEQIKDFNE